MNPLHRTAPIHNLLQPNVGEVSRCSVTTYLGGELWLEVGDWYTGPLQDPMVTTLMLLLPWWPEVSDVIPQEECELAQAA